MSKPTLSYDSLHIGRVATQLSVPGFYSSSFPFLFFVVHLPSLHRLFVWKPLPPSILFDAAAIFSVFSLPSLPFVSVFPRAVSI